MSLLRGVSFPLRFDPDNQILYVASKGDGNYWAVTVGVKVPL